MSDPCTPLFVHFESSGGLTSKMIDQTFLLMCRETIERCSGWEEVGSTIGDKLISPSDDADNVLSHPSL